MNDNDIRLAQYVFMESFHDAMKSLVTNNDFSSYGRMMFAINEFVLYGNEPNICDFDNVETAIWKLIKPVISKTRAKATAGKAGGAKSKGGGAPVGNSNAAKTTSKQQADNKQTTTKSKKTTTDKGYKDKRIKENIEKKDELSFSVSSSPEFIKFCDWIKSQLPHVAKMEKQMNEKQMNTLITKFGKDKLFNIMRQMENSKNKKTGRTIENCYTSVYLTANNWLRKDEKSSDHE